MMTATPDHPDDLRQLATKLGFHGLAERWEDYADRPWIPEILAIEDAERQTRSLARRIASARIGRFKPMADFDWSWPKNYDRDLVEELFSFGFLKEGANVILVGPNGVGKTMIAQNLAHQAVLAGHVVRFVMASDMLNELGSQESSAGLDRKLKKYATPALLVCDEVGYLSYSNRHADLLFEVVTRRYNAGRSTAITTNRPFGDWTEMFPSAACLVTLIDRLIHKSEIVKLEGASYRLKEAKERAAEKAKSRAPRRRSRRRMETPVQVAHA
jgi:DNA replication protein DnaC